MITSLRCTRFFHVRKVAWVSNFTGGQTKARAWARGPKGGAGIGKGIPEPAGWLGWTQPGTLTGRRRPPSGQPSSAALALGLAPCPALTTAAPSCPSHQGF